MGEMRRFQTFAPRSGAARFDPFRTFGPAYEIGEQIYATTCF